MLLNTNKGEIGLSIKESIKRRLGIKSPSEYYSQQPSGLVEGMKKPVSSRAGGAVIYVCLDCDYTASERMLREEYKEMKLCPECGGMYVDCFESNIIARHRETIRKKANNKHD